MTGVRWTALGIMYLGLALVIYACFLFSPVIGWLVLGITLVCVGSSAYVAEGKNPATRVEQEVLKVGLNRPPPPRSSTGTPGMN